MTQDINNIHDVIAFIELIAEEIQDSNPFEEFRNPQRYTPEEVALREDLMEQCFEVCAQQPQNIKYLMLVVFNEALTGATSLQAPV
jgi:hypothetical protein